MQSHRNAWELRFIGAKFYREAAAVFFLLCCCATLPAWSQDSDQGPGPDTVIVHSMFGGQIFGFDVDQNGTEGILSESQDIAGGKVLAAVETFDQRTGQILKVVSQTETQDNFVTLGIVGNHVGLVEYEHEVSFLHIQYKFPMLSPLGTNQFTRLWTPALPANHLLKGISRTQGSPNAAFYVYDNTAQTFKPAVFSSNVAENTFGRPVLLPDIFNGGAFPVLAYNSISNQAVLAVANEGNPQAPEIAIADLTSGKVDTFRGVGIGIPAGIAVDSEDNIGCTSTVFDFSVEFYDLTTHIGFSEILPGATSEFNSASDVQYDPIHKLFLLAQENSSLAPGGSSILVYDTKGNFVEAINGLSFNDTFLVTPTHIALHPSVRAGFVDGPDLGVTEIQSFTY
jgi:hypothetical protein